MTLKTVRLCGFEHLIVNRSVETMQRVAENILNPNRYHLTKEARKRLGWMYIIIYECRGNTARAARKIGISRTWLSTLKNKWEFHRRDPRFLEPESRPPKIIKDYKPGALIEKDMKFILKSNKFLNFEKYRAKENFFYQHTVIDSFTRIRAIGLCEESDSQTAAAVQEKAITRLPFPIACANTDNGGENEGNFSRYLENNDIFQFFSRSGTPTDNPRVERSHLADELEFWNRFGKRTTFEEKSAALRKWEHIYNFIRPHQALGMLTPMEFYELWKTEPKKAYAIKDKYQKYLRKNARRLAASRRMKSKEQIEKLMRQIDEKLINSYQ